MFIVATGMVCPIGLSASAACTAMRAGISAFKKLPYIDGQEQPVAGATVPGIDAFPRLARQLLELLVKSLANLLESTPPVAWDRVPLLIGFAEPGRTDAQDDLAGNVIAQVQRALGVNFLTNQSRVYATGHTSVFEAIADARQLLEDLAIPACLVCSVDSLINDFTLLSLESRFRLKTPGNRDGLIPGEAAAAVLLQKRSSNPSMTEIIGLGFGEEKAHILSEEPQLGLGLTQAARMALAEAKLELQEIDWRLSDVTGELYGFKELSMIEARLMRSGRKKAQPLWHWADVVGDTGAAVGALQLIAADEAFRKNYAPGERVICFASSEAGKRAAAILRRNQP